MNEFLIRKQAAYYRISDELTTEHNKLIHYIASHRSNYQKLDPVFDFLAFNVETNTSIHIKVWIVNEEDDFKSVKQIIEEISECSQKLNDWLLKMNELSMLIDFKIKNNLLDKLAKI